MSYITTYTRKHFDPVHPDPERICIQDIAHALPLICRGNGHVSTFGLLGSIVFAVRRRLLGEGIPIVRRWLVFCMMPASAICQMCLVR